MAKDDIPNWANDVAKVILESVRQKDSFTFEHCCRVGRAARRLGKAMSLSEHEQMILEYSGLFHDIGKVGVPDNILLKPARLEPDEIDLMKSHPLKSLEMLKPLEHITFFRFLFPGIKYHHEKFDGSGYPFNLVGEKIPLVARILAVVDTVDAMTNTRPYRKGLSMDVVKKELIDYSNTQFDGAIVKIYLEAIKHWQEIEVAETDELIVSEIYKAA